MDTYINFNGAKCVRCYRCIRLCMGEYGKYDLGSLIIGYNGTPRYNDDYVACHHCNLPVNTDGAYDEENGVMTHSPCMKICPVNAIEIERW